MSSKINNNVQTLHHRFQFYGKNAREWIRKCIMMLPDIDRERVWEKKGFGSLTEYTARLAGMSHKTTIDGLRVMQVIEHMPAMIKVVEKRGINCVKPIITLLRPENQAFWAEKAHILSQHALQTYVHEMKVQHNPMIPKEMWLDHENDQSNKGNTGNYFQTGELFGEGALSESEEFSHQEAIKNSAVKNQTSQEQTKNTLQSHKKIIPIDLTPATLARLEKLKGDHDWDTLMNELMDLREKRLQDEQEHIQQTHPAATHASSRYIPADILKFILRRSRGLCEFGTCQKQYDILHHTKRFALEQTHNPEHIIALCTTHERITHQGLVENEHEEPRHWKVREHPDITSPTYAIDELVMKYRRPK